MAKPGVVEGAEGAMTTYDVRQAGETRGAVSEKGFVVRFNIWCDFVESRVRVKIVAGTRDVESILLESKIELRRIDAWSVGMAILEVS